MRNDDPRIIGRFDERISLLTLADSVYQLLPNLHSDVDFDHEAFAHITIGFLRENANGRKLWGLCSFSKPKQYYKVAFKDRHGIHRILIDRRLLTKNPAECVRTIHHEFVHAILKERGSSHGPIFQEHDVRIIPHIASILER